MNAFITIANTLITVKFLRRLLLVLCAAAGFVLAQSSTASKETAKDEQPKFALLVGISKYKDGKPSNIDGCENNVTLLKGALADKFGFPDKPENILTLKNENATHAAITAAFKTYLIANAKKAKEKGKQAVIIYYFCGHGSQYPNAKGDDDESDDDMDETFVAWDSRGGDAFDILDDEIADLQFELAKYTKNTTLIFESCHSGTGARSPASDVGIEKTDPDNRKRTAYVRQNAESKQRPDPASYTSVSAADSRMQAKSETLEHTTTPYSYMTKSLVQALNKATSTTTYRELMRDVRDSVRLMGNPSDNQEPQIEGNRDVPIFDGTANRTTPFFEVTNAGPADNQVTINAGAVHGLHVDSQISFYEKGTDKLGADGWLANGIVTAVRNFDADVLVGTSPKITAGAKVDKASRAMLASPVFGVGPVFVDLGLTDRSTSVGGNNELKSEIEMRLEKSGLMKSDMLKLGKPPLPVTGQRSAGVEQTSAPTGTIRLGKSTVKELFANQGNPNAIRREIISPLTSEKRCDGNDLKVNEDSLRFPAADREVYYLYTNDQGGPPLFGKVFDPADTNLAEKIAGVIQSFTYQRNLKGLDYRSSKLDEQIQVSLSAIPEDAIVEGCKDGAKTFLPVREKFKTLQTVATGFTNDGSYGEASVPAKSYVRINIKNNSSEELRKLDPEKITGQPLHVAVLALTNHGEVKNIYGSTGANEPLKPCNNPGDRCEVNIVLRLDLPVATERYIFVVSRQYIDFSFFEFRGAWRAPLSPLERILTQSGKLTRDQGTVVDEPDKWGVKHLDLNITVPAARVVTAKTPQIGK